MNDPHFGTTALDSAHLEIVTFQGRDYQKYALDNQIYFAPIDDEEIERLELEQQVFSRVFDDRIIFPPIQQLAKVLDCGYGSGAWAVEVAEQYPNCEVIGIDVSPHMKPDDMPDNLWLQVDDLNRTFTFRSNQFDLIHSRLVSSGLDKERWPRYLRDIASVWDTFRCLKRGGWVQMVEIYFNVQSDSGTLTESHCLRRWSRDYIAALEGVKDLRSGMKLANLMASAGLVDIESKMIPLPLSGWSTDPRMRAIGEANRENTHLFLESLGLYPLMHRLDMPEVQFQELLAGARQEASDPSLKAYIPL
ncbi:hypothetical protein McanMca71_004307 [Microsporum canis]